MLTTNLLRTFGAAAILTCAACVVDPGGGQDQPDSLASARIALVQAPSDTNCARITVTGSRTIQRTFTLTPGQPSTLALSGLPVGNATFVGEALAEACSAVTSASVPNWLSDPVAVTLVAATSTNVTLHLHRNASANISLDFTADAPNPAGGPFLLTCFCADGTRPQLCTTDCAAANRLATCQPACGGALDATGPGSCFAGMAPCAPPPPTPNPADGPFLLTCFCADGTRPQLCTTDCAAANRLATCQPACGGALDATGPGSCFAGMAPCAPPPPTPNPADGPFLLTCFCADGTRPQLCTTDCAAANRLATCQPACGGALDATGPGSCFAGMAPCAP